LSKKKLILFCSWLVFFIFNAYTNPKPGDNFKRENLVVWAIVPYDLKERGPEKRAKMLVDLGISRCAYDWRKGNIEEFEEEILQYKKHNIEYVAFWNIHARAVELFKKYNMSPQIWKTLKVKENVPEQNRVNKALQNLMPAVKKAKELGSLFGLYNHGGWGGKPQNMVAVCKAFHKKGFTHVRIVYNFHHAHGDIESFPKNLKIMQPFLLAINLNGMDGEKDLGAENENKIKIIGQGKYEKDMIRAIIHSGYNGTIGIIGHTKTRDVKEVLTENINGLMKLLEKLH